LLAFRYLTAKSKYIFFQIFNRTTECCWIQV